MAEAKLDKSNRSKEIEWNHKQCIMLTNFVIDQSQNFEYAFFLKKFKRNQVIYLMGDPSDELFYIKDGKVKTSVIAIDGKERVLEYYEKGNYFGEICLCANSKRLEQAIAFEDSIVSSIKARDFLNLLNTHKDILQRFLNFFSKKLSEYSYKLEKITYENAFFKIAKALLRNSKENLTNSESIDRKVPLSISNDQLSQKLMIEKRIINEILNRFQKENLIEYRKQNIVVYIDRLLDYIIK